MSLKLVPFMIQKLTSHPAQPLGTRKGPRWDATWGPYGIPFGVSITLLAAGSARGPSGISHTTWDPDGSHFTVEF